MRNSKQSYARKTHSSICCHTNFRQTQRMPKLRVRFYRSKKHILCLCRLLRLCRKSMIQYLPANRNTQFAVFHTFFSVYCGHRKCLPRKGSHIRRRLIASPTGREPTAQIRGPMRASAPTEDNAPTASVGVDPQIDPPLSVSCADRQAWNVARFSRVRMLSPRLAAGASQGGREPTAQSPIAPQAHHNSTLHSPLSAPFLFVLRILYRLLLAKAPGM